eukprot:jgi/Mesvir1/6967/Mv09112-RA.1
MATSQRKRVAVVVLGDFGRSPRMQYHTLSLAKQADMDVDVVAYQGVAPIEDVLTHPRITLHLVKPPPFHSLPRLLFLLLAPLKILLQLAQLFWLLLVTIPRPHVLLVQNPPSIPTFLVAVTVQRLRKCRLIIDWHNFGYSLLALRLGPRHPVVRFAHWYERVLGRHGDAHLCVTRAMRKELATRWGILATVLYDQAPRGFHTCSNEERHELFARLARDINVEVTGGGSASGAGNAGLGPHNPAFQTQPARQLTVATEAVPADNSTAALGGPSVGQSPRGRKKGKKPLPAGEGQGHAYASNDTDGNVNYAGGALVVKERADRPALLVSSTSWTADEDMTMLMEAAVAYDRRLAAITGEDSDGTYSYPGEDEGGEREGRGGRGRGLTGSRSAGGGHSHGGGAEEERVVLLSDEGQGDVGETSGQDGTQPPPPVLFQTGAPVPSLLIFITGKGPMRAAFERQLASLRLRRVAFRTLWLAAEDYPRLLGSVDLGVCLHTSSSGLDLPMKVVDMFGCGLPVCAVRYACIHELVRHDENGLLFSSSGQLAQYLWDLFQGFRGGGGGGTPLLGKLRSSAQAKGRASRWEEEWARCALPVIREQCGDLAKRD